MHESEAASQTQEETNGDRRQRDARMVPHLFLVLECARPWAGGSRHDLAQIDEIWIGRGAKRSASRTVQAGVRTLELRIPDARMSQKHGRIVREGAKFVYHDLGSTNGSRVGRELVTEPISIRDGDTLEIGRTFLRFRTALATPATTLADADTERGPSDRPPGFATLIPDLVDKYARIERVAASRVPVLLLGETGTGKEVVAHAIHRKSGRAGNLVAVNCGAIPSTLLEAQLFGHTRGAFSGATREQPGFVRSSDGGTLFLDEIGDLPVAAQPSLLRVLQEGEVVPVGAAKPCGVDLRVISATHRDLQDCIAGSTFRADLFARLAGFTHVLVPLRERIEDLGVLVAALLPTLAPERARSLTFSPRVVRSLLESDWPLNVRGLRQQLSVAVVMATDDFIDVEHLDTGSPLEPRAEGADDADLRVRLVEELSRNAGNVSEVARAMGKARMQIHRWLKRFDIDPKTFRTS
jgi:DNA-binding NtrC family response regulator